MQFTTCEVDEYNKMFKIGRPRGVEAQRNKIKYKLQFHNFRKTGKQPRITIFVTNLGINSYKMITIPVGKFVANNTRYYYLLVISI